MRERRLQGIGLLVAGAALVVAPGAALAKNKNKNRSYEPPGEYRVIEFACGSNDGSFPGAVAGDYAATISALNAGTSEVRVLARVVLTVPETLRSDEVTARIGAGGVRVLDCDDLLGGIFAFPQDLPAEGYFQGFLLEKNAGPLTVTTRRSAGGDGIASAEAETIPPQTTSMPRDAHDGVVICHVPPGNPGNAHTIEVDASAVQAHRHHGDYEGACSHQDAGWDD